MPSPNAVEGTIVNSPEVLSAFTVPITVIPFSKLTVLPASAVPVMESVVISFVIDADV